MRHRIRSYQYLGGTATWKGLGSLGDQPGYGTASSDSYDEVGNFTEVNPLSIEHVNNVCWTLTGYSQPGGAASSGWDYGGYAYTSPAGVHLAAGSIEPSDNWSVSEALAKSNVNRPSVDLPVFLVELKDIPEMVSSTLRVALKRAGKLSRFDKRLLKAANQKYREPVWNGTKEASDFFLGYTFGVEPFFRDLYRMMDFTNQVEQRAQAIRGLYSGKGLSRRTTVWTDNVDFPPWRTYQTSFYSESTVVNAIWRTSRIKWVSTKWVPTNPPQYQTDAELHQLANSLVFGRNISMATIYELMPWSWLLDWFSNVGNIVASTRNSLPVTHQNTCIMQTTTTRLVSHEREGPNSSYSTLSAPGLPTRITKSRYRYDLPLLPEFRLPFLNGKQLSILSALVGKRNPNQY